MARSTAKSPALLPPSWAIAIERGVIVAAGALVVLVAAALLLALVSFNALDPSFNRVTVAQPTNIMGGFGAHVADLMLQVAGVASALFVPSVAVIGVRLMRRRGIAGWRRGMEHRRTELRAAMRFAAHASTSAAGHATQAG